MPEQEQLGLFGKGKEVMVVGMTGVFGVEGLMNLQGGRSLPWELAHLVGARRVVVTPMFEHERR